MSGVLTAEEIRSISPAPERVRVSFLCNDSQLDVSLPLDVPIVTLLPQLVKLAQARDSGQTDASDDPSTAEAKNTIWVLSRNNGDTPLQPDITLREAGVAETELLWLTAERALSAPTLYDDVVDAAARLNQAGYPGWNPTAARWMAFAGVYLASGGWVFFLLGNTFAPSRTAFALLSAAVSVGLTGTAALAYRRHGQRDIGAALGWAAVPIVAADTWVVLHGQGRYGMAGACGAIVVVAFVLFRFVGTGRWGYLAVQVISFLAGLALVARTAGLPAHLAGAGLALGATLGCLAVPRLTVRFGRVKVEAPEAASVWAQVEAETSTRSALYTGLAISGTLGAFVVLTSPGAARWSGVAFALGCAAALGFYTLRPATALERAGLAIPAAGLLIVTCALAQRGSQPMPTAAFGILLLSTLVFALVGAGVRPGRQPKWLKTSLAHLDYVITAALIPLALWAVGAYGPEGFP